jgi:glyoxylase-like metal-dependent hydrolase (beta-lactamase superfamily II)
MIIKNIIVGPLETNAYIIGDDNHRMAMVIDPGDEPERIMDEVENLRLKVEKIILTHAHFDHIGAAGDIKTRTGAEILLHRDDLETYKYAKDQAVMFGFDIDDLPSPDRFLQEGDEIKIGKLIFKVLHTPGHSKGGICLYGEGILISGDTIFQGSVGRTDFPGGSTQELASSFRRLLSLPKDTRILPGHGPETTVGIERETNYFVKEFGLI